MKNFNLGFSSVDLWLFDAKNKMAETVFIYGYVSFEFHVHNLFLFCFLSDSFTKMWKNGTNVLFVDKTKLSKDHRLTKFDNNTLQIRYALIYDSGNYTCQVAAKPNVEVIHIVNVVSKYSVEIRVRK